MKDHIQIQVINTILTVNTQAQWSSAVNLQSIKIIINEIKLNKINQIEQRVAVRASQDKLLYPINYLAHISVIVSIFGTS